MAKMTEFDYDVRDRKRVASMAKYKKNGSKSKKCSLPSDGMTRKQWEKKNGEVKTYTMNKPMSWEEFKKMPIDIQKGYIGELVARFGLTYNALGQMFGCIPPTVRRHFEKNQFAVSFKRGKSMNEEQRSEWETFIGGAAHDDAAVTNEPAEAVLNEEVAMTEEPEQSVIVEEKPENKLATMLREFSLIFEGSIDPISIGNSIAAIVGNKSSGRIEVRCFL